MEIISACYRADAIHISTYRAYFLSFVHIITETKCTRVSKSCWFQYTNTDRQCRSFGQCRTKDIIYTLRANVCKLKV